MKKIDNKENNFIDQQDHVSLEGANLIVELDVLIPVIREQLAAGQAVRFTPTGVSMEPMLRHGIDNVVLGPVPECLVRYDLPLYQRDNGQYVLHRVVEVKSEASHCENCGDGKKRADYTYTCMGDNQFVGEAGLRHDQMIGVVTEFYRGGHRHLIDETGYKIYCRAWYHSRHLRHFFKRAVRKLRRMLSPRG